MSPHTVREYSPPLTVLPPLVHKAKEYTHTPHILLCKVCGGINWKTLKLLNNDFIGSCVCMCVCVCEAYSAVALKSGNKPALYFCEEFLFHFSFYLRARTNTRICQSKKNGTFLYVLSSYFFFVRQINYIFQLF